MSYRTALTALALVALMGRDAGADENPCPDPGCRLKSPSTLTTDGGSVLRLPPGYFLDDTTFQRRDAELKAAQDQVVRLKAENDSFRKNAGTWAPVVGVVVSLVGGALILHYTK